MHTHNIIILTHVFVHDGVNIMESHPSVSVENDVPVLLKASGPTVLTDTNPDSVGVVLGFNSPVVGTVVEVTATLSFNLNNDGEGNT